MLTGFGPYSSNAPNDRCENTSESRCRLERLIPNRGVVLNIDAINDRTTGVTETQSVIVPLQYSSETGKVYWTFDGIKPVLTFEFAQN